MCNASCAAPGGLPTLPPAEGWFCLLTQQLNLFRIQDSAEGPMVSLMHQRFRDCLAAIHLLNLSHSLIPGAPLPEAWQTSIDVYVMDFTAELATPGGGRPPLGSQPHRPAHQPKRHPEHAGAAKASEGLRLLPAEF